MDLRAYIYINYKNIVVLKSYLDVVKSAIERVGIPCEYRNSLEGVKKSDLVIFPMGNDAFKYYLKGYHNFILWMQGVTADESYIRHQSKIRYFVLNQVDLFAMKRAKAILYVSDYLRQHYEKIGKCSFKNKSYIMPCFNEEYDETIYKGKDYSRKIFTYVGSLSLWQCFDQTASLYKKIEDTIPETTFKVLTFDTQNAEKIIKEKGIKNYEVKCVPKEEVLKEICTATYGFIIRDDIMINRVATPTKISSYMSAGVIPIFSSCLTDFYKVSKSLQYALAVDNLGVNGLKKVIDFIKKPVVKEELQQEYKKVFETYFNKDIHCSNLESLFRKLL